MFKSIKIRGREQMIRESESITDPCIIVSISGKTTPFPVFSDNPNIKEVLYLSFSDYEHDPECITTEDAQNIADFIKKYEDDDIDIYFHCRQGISRSSGCAAALMYYETKNIDSIMEDPNYNPNLKCFTRVLKALGYHLSMEEYIKVEDAKRNKYYYY